MDLYRAVLRTRFRVIPMNVFDPSDRLSRSVLVMLSDASIEPSAVDDRSGYI
jgi:hypothetical protein